MKKFFKNVIRYFRSKPYRDYLKMRRLVKKADKFVFTVDLIMRNSRISRSRRRKFWMEFIKDDKNRAHVMHYFEDIFVRGEKR